MKNKIVIEDCLALPYLDFDKMVAILTEFNVIVAMLRDKESPEISTLKHFFVYKGGSHYAVHQIIDREVQKERIILYEF